jgi:menaquinone-dependent protoporphyrinogen oxidase
MAMNVLVAYASKYGSTEAVAKAVAEALREGGLSVDARPMRTIQTLDFYSAVVLGAPLYIGQWHKDALSFLSRHREALAQRPIAIFALGPLSADEKAMQASRAQLDQELAQFPWLTPVAVATFGGKYNPATLNIPDRLITGLPASPLHGMLACDLRDWAAISAWADELVVKLQPVVAQ